MMEQINGTQEQNKSWLAGKLGYVFLFLGAILTGVLIVMVVGPQIRPYQFKGSKIDPPAPAADFSLVNQHGEIYTLGEARGKVVLLFFGYTHCPDICPTTLAEFKQVREELGERAEEVDFLFITIDPERDTSERLAQYMPVFGDWLHGLTGTMDDLQPVYQKYGVVRNKVESDSAAGYLMEHSTRTYVIDRNGRIRATYLFGTTTDSMVQDTLYLLREG